MASAAPPTGKWTSAPQDCGVRGEAFHYLSMVRQSDTFFSLPFHPSKTGRRWHHESYRRIQRTRHAGEADGNRVQHLPGALPDAEIDDAGVQGGGGALPQMRRDDRRPGPGDGRRVSAAGGSGEKNGQPSQAASPEGKRRDPCRTGGFPSGTNPSRPAAGGGDDSTPNVACGRGKPRGGRPRQRLLP